MPFMMPDLKENNHFSLEQGFSFTRKKNIANQKKLREAKTLMAVDDGRQ